MATRKTNHDRKMEQFRCAGILGIKLQSGQLMSDCDWAKQNHGKEFPPEAAPKIPQRGCKQCACFYYYQSPL